MYANFSDDSDILSALEELEDELLKDLTEEKREIYENIIQLLNERNDKIDRHMFNERLSLSTQLILESNRV